MSQFETAADLGVHLEDDEGDEVSDSVAELAAVNRRVLRLAAAQSRDIGRRLEADGVRVLRGVGRLVSAARVRAELERRRRSRSSPPTSCSWRPAPRPRVMATAQPDGERILTWQQIYALQELPEKLVVVGSGVTGAELAQAYLGLGCEVTLVSSRDRVLPGEDADAATVIEDVFRKRGMEVLEPLPHGRRSSAPTTGVLVRLEDGREVEGSPRPAGCRLRPADRGLGLEEVGVALGAVGPRLGRPGLAHVGARRVCRGRLHRASFPWRPWRRCRAGSRCAHALGDAVAPLNLRAVSANIFTDPEIATVGFSQKDVDEGRSTPRR